MILMENMTTKYEVAYFKLYNQSHKELQDKLDRAALDATYDTDYQVRSFIRRVIENAETE